MKIFKRGKEWQRGEMVREERSKGEAEERKKRFTCPGERTYMTFLGKRRGWREARERKSKKMKEGRP
jgi:hypothetical protein